MMMMMIVFINDNNSDNNNNANNKNSVNNSTGVNNSTSVINLTNDNQKNNRPVSVDADVHIETDLHEFFCNARTFPRTLKLKKLIPTPRAHVSRTTARVDNSHLKAITSFISVGAASRSGIEDRPFV